MNIQITGKHCDTSTELKKHITKMVGNLSKYYEKITNVSVTVQYIGEHKRCIDLNVSIPNKTLHFSSKEANMSLAIKASVEKAVRQLKKENEKIKQH